jgi:hypothetical protein
VFFFFQVSFELFLYVPCYLLNTSICEVSINGLRDGKDASTSNQMLNSYYVSCSFPLIDIFFRFQITCPSFFVSIVYWLNAGHWDFTLLVLDISVFF